MTFLQAILALFAVVDPIGNIPLFMHAVDRLPPGQSSKAFNTATGVAAVILITFCFAGKAVLNYVFHINLPDLQLAAGILLLIIAINHLIFGTVKKNITVNPELTAQEVGCVPLACPLLAGPGAMATCITILEKSGPSHAFIAIGTVFGIAWLIMRFIEPLHNLLGRLFCLVFSKVMCLFIAALGIHMIMTGIKTYFPG